ALAEEVLDAPDSPAGACRLEADLRVGTLLGGELLVEFQRLEEEFPLQRLHPGHGIQLLGELRVQPIDRLAGQPEVRPGLPLAPLRASRPPARPPARGGPCPSGPARARSGRCSPPARRRRGPGGPPARRPPTRRRSGASRSISRRDRADSAAARRSGGARGIAQARRSAPLPSHHAAPGPAAS